MRKGDLVCSQNFKNSGNPEVSLQLGLADVWEALRSRVETELALSFILLAALVEYIMADDNDRRELSRNSKSGGNDSKDAPATMAKGEKPSGDDN